MRKIIESKILQPSDMNKILSDSRLSNKELSIVNYNMHKYKNLMERLKYV